MLCVLGKYKVHELDEDQRVKIVQYRDSSFCSRLEDKAIECIGKVVASRKSIMKTRTAAPKLVAEPDWTSLIAAF